MSKYFTEQDIDNYRQCFKLYAPDGFVTSADKLGFIMRSLDLSPTVTELAKYYETYKKEDGVIDFAEFLNIIHLHLQSASPNKEILAAFKAYDVRKTGYLTAKELRSILTSTGERLTNKDVDMIIQEVNGGILSGSEGRVSYEQLLRVISSPIQFK